MCGKPGAEGAPQEGALPGHKQESGSSHAAGWRSAGGSGPSAWARCVTPGRHRSPRAADLVFTPAPSVFHTPTRSPRARRGKPHGRHPLTQRSLWFRPRGRPPRRRLVPAPSTGAGSGEGFRGSVEDTTRTWCHLTVYEPCLVVSKLKHGSRGLSLR